MKRPEHGTDYVFMILFSLAIIIIIVIMWWEAAG